MVLELIALTGLPVAIATVEGVRHQTEQSRQQDEQYRMRDFYIDVYCNARSRKRSQVDRTMVVLKNGKVVLLVVFVIIGISFRQANNTKRTALPSS